MLYFFTYCRSIWRNFMIEGEHQTTSNTLVLYRPNRKWDIVWTISGIKWKSNNIQTAIFWGVSGTDEHDATLLSSTSNIAYEWPATQQLLVTIVSYTLKYTRSTRGWRVEAGAVNNMWAGYEWLHSGVELPPCPGITAPPVIDGISPTALNATFIVPYHCCDSLYIWRGALLSGANLPNCLSALELKLQTERSLLIIK